MDFTLLATPPEPTKNARKRLLRDIIEWNQYAHECPMVTAAPLQENIFEWHINMCATSGALRGIIIHMIATFPPDYPQQPPSIRICSHFKHPNVFSRGSYEWRYEKRQRSFGSRMDWVRKWVHSRDHFYICLDMLDKMDSDAQRDRQVVQDSYHGVFS